MVTLDGEILDRLEERIPGPEAWSRIVPVFTAREAKRSEGRPVLGRYRREARHELTFSPGLPLVPGRSYTVRLRWNGIAAFLEEPRLVRSPVEWRFRVPGAPPAKPPVGLSIEPAGGAIPVNLLRIHLGFDRPMRSESVEQHVRLVSSAGNEIPGVLVPVPGGLWDPTGRRLTLLLRPDRGETRDASARPALRPGERVELVVSGSWPDRSGAPLGRTVRKGWVVTMPDRRAPDSRSWILRVPAVDGEDPLRVEFHDVLDAALLRRSLDVVLGDEVVPGRWLVRNGGRAAAFLPARRWSSERYRLVVAGSLEDLAGHPVRGPRDLEFRPVSPSEGTPQSVSASL